MLMIMKLFTMLFSHAAPHQRNVQCVVTTCLWFYCWWYCLQCWCTKSEEYPMCGNNLFVVLLLMILFTMLVHHIRGISNVWQQLVCGFIADDIVYNVAAPHQRNIQCVATTCLWFYCWWYCLQCCCTKSEEYPMRGNNFCQTYPLSSFTSSQMK